MVLFSLFILFPSMVFAEDKQVSPALYATFWALIPPIVAIALALLTKEVYSSLFIGIFIGGLFYSNFSIEGALNHILTDGIVTVLSDKYNVGILVFLVVLGAIVSLMNATGGSSSFGEWTEKRISTRKGAQFLTIILGLIVFIDDYFNCLTVGSVMKPISDKYKLSRAKLAYLIDSTAAPVCIIAPISSWAAAVTGFVPGADGFQVFIQAIPYNFYAFLTIFMMFAITWMDFDFGPMKTHEENAKNGDIYTTPERPYDNIASHEVSGKGNVNDLVIPVLILIFFCAAGMLYSGGFFTGVGFIEAFSGSDASFGLSLGSMIALVLIILFYITRRVLSFHECMECIPEGFKSMVSAILILTFAWTLKSMTDSLGASAFVEEVMKNTTGQFMNFVPAVVFVVGCALAFATGTSWGTFGILIPIVVSVFVGHDKTMMIISISACMAGAVCGDHCSPISDTTIMSSAGAQCSHINHVNTQMPYAMTVAAVSFVNYVIAGFVKSAVIMLPLSFVLMFLTLVILKKVTSPKSVTVNTLNPSNES
jgi:Na+/H+ antiporter family protein